MNGCLEWDLFRCPNAFKIYPNCKLKEDVSNDDLEERKREINKKDFTININLTPDLFIQNVENAEDEEDANTQNTSKKR